MKRNQPKSAAAASSSSETAQPKIFGPLRPEPATLFNRTSRTSLTTLALVNAMMLAGSLEAQSVAKPAATPAPGSVENAATATTVDSSQTPVNTMSEVVVTAQPSTYKVDRVESPKHTAPLLDTPQSITVIPQAVMQEQNATTLRDVLRNVPGISMQAGEGGTPAGDALSIRGFSARTDMFIDGIRDIGGYSRDPFNFEQIEVSKGPASAYAGRGSTGGEINLVTKTPHLEPSYAGTAGIGTDNYQRYTLDLNQPLEKVRIPGAAFRLNMLWNHNDVPGRNEVDNERWGIAPSLAFGLGTPTRLTLSYLHLQEDNQPDYGIPWVPDTNIPLAKYANQAPPVNFDNYYGLKSRDFEKTVTDVVTAEFEHDFSDSITLRDVFRYGQTARDSLTASPRFASTTTTDILREFKSRDQVDSIVADQLDLNLKFDTFGWGHIMNVGAEYDHEYSKNKARIGPDAPFTDLYNPNPFQHYSGPITETGAWTEATTDSVGLYAFDTVKLAEQFSLNGGLRWDYFGVDYESKPETGPSTYLSHADKFLSWRIGPVYKPRPNGSIYMAYGTSFNPSAEGLTLTDATAELEPESAATFEMGTKWDLLDNRLSLSAAIFRTEKNNARTPGLTPDDPPTVLNGKQRVDGLELGAAGNITDAWKVFGAFTYLNSEILNSNTPAEVGRRMPNTPQTSFSLWTTYELPWHITLGGGARYVGSRFNDTANLRKAPDYWVFDAMASYQITENLEARLNIYNLANERYIDSLGGGHFIPGPSRSGTLTLSFKF